jgi:ribosomal protein S1
MTDKQSQKTFDELIQKKTEEIKKEKKDDYDFFVSQVAKEFLPKVGGTIKGKVIEMTKNIVRLDLGSFGFGVVRGEELWESMDAYVDLKVGDVVEVTVIELENEEGEMELSFRKLSKLSAWQELNQKREKREIITIKIQSANKGGLLSTIFGISAFMPVSQLIPEHYPRVEGGDSARILSKLQQFVGQKMRVKILSADPKEDKLIISEKAAVLDEQKKRLALLKIGDVVEGIVSGVVDFGAFVKFPSLRKNDEIFEGLIHISEVSWQRVKDIKDVIKIGQKVKAEIIGIDFSKITLSLKKLTKDPWQEEVKKYKVGQKVKGEVLKIEPFGAFVQLDKTIQGLAHISELSSKKIKNAAEVLKIGKKYEFKILSIEPEEHRLGLSLRALEEKENKEQSKPKEKKPEKSKVKKEK